MFQVFRVGEVDELNQNNYLATVDNCSDVYELDLFKENLFTTIV